MAQPPLTANELVPLISTITDFSSLHLSCQTIRWKEIEIWRDRSAFGLKMMRNRRMPRVSGSFTDCKTHVKNLGEMVLGLRKP